VNKPKFAVIAGNYDQFRYYVENIGKPKIWDYFYVGNAKDLMGKRGVNFEFYGAWYERNDTSEIGERLRMCNLGTGWEYKTTNFLDY